MNPNIAPAPGLRLAERYELVSLIATGGMAQVWQATDTVLGRPVAAKILHPHLATDRGFLIRFRREAVAAARLSHPGIVSIYDTVTQPGLEVIVMELVDGQTLRTKLDAQGVLSVPGAIDLGMQPVVQVAAELFVLDCLFEVTIGSGDDAGVRADGFRAADTLERLVLQDSQDFGLHQRRHVADFVQEQRSVFAQLKLTHLLAIGSGERSFFVTEQFAFE